MKQKKMRTSYAKYIQVGSFNKTKFIEEKRKILKHMCIKLTDEDESIMHSMESPRQIENFVSRIIHTRLN